MSETGWIKSKPAARKQVQRKLVPSDYRNPVALRKSTRRSSSPLLDDNLSNHGVTGSDRQKKRKIGDKAVVEDSQNPGRDQENQIPDPNPFVKPAPAKKRRLDQDSILTPVTNGRIRGQVSTNPATPPKTSIKQQRKLLKTPDAKLIEVPDSSSPLSQALSMSSPAPVHAIRVAAIHHNDQVPSSLAWETWDDSIKTTGKKDAELGTAFGPASPLHSNISKKIKGKRNFTVTNLVNPKVLTPPMKGISKHRHNSPAKYLDQDPKDPKFSEASPFKSPASSRRFEQEQQRTPPPTEPEGFNAKGKLEHIFQTLASPLGDYADDHSSQIDDSQFPIQTHRLLDPIHPDNSGKAGTKIKELLSPFARAADAASPGMHKSIGTSVLSSNRLSEVNIRDSALKLHLESNEDGQIARPALAILADRQRLGLDGMNGFWAADYGLPPNTDSPTSQDRCLSEPTLPTLKHADSQAQDDRGRLGDRPQRSMEFDIPPISYDDSLLETYLPPPLPDYFMHQSQGQIYSDDTFADTFPAPPPISLSSDPDQYYNEGLPFLKASIPTTMSHSKRLPDTQDTTQLEPFTDHGFASLPGSDSRSQRPGARIKSLYSDNTYGELDDHAHEYEHEDGEEGAEGDPDLIRPKYEIVGGTRNRPETRGPPYLGNIPGSHDDAASSTCEDDSSSTGPPSLFAQWEV